MKYSTTMSSRNENKIREKIEARFLEVAGNFKYSHGILYLEKQIARYPFLSDNEDILGKLGLLYDHAALQFKDKKQRYEYEEKAFSIYKKILKINPKSCSAVWGIGRIWWHRKNKKAIPFALKAYRLSRHNKTEGGLYAQNVGLCYEAIGKYALAEKWLLKGHRENKKEIGVYINLVQFYLLRKKAQKAKIFLRMIKALFKKEKKDFKKSPWGTKVKELINKLERESDKKGQ